MMSDRIFRGDVVEARLDPTEGAEIKKKRPCVVIQNDTGNKVSPLTIVAPITGAEHKTTLFAVYVAVSKGEGGLGKDSVILCDQIRTIDKKRVVRSLGKLSASVMDRVDRALKVSLALQ